jgi:hypothetical protein
MVRALYDALQYYVAILLQIAYYVAMQIAIPWSNTITDCNAI